MKLSEAPGCIGSPVIRSEAATLCKTCIVRTACGKLAVRNAERIARELGVEAIDPKKPGRATAGGKHVDIRLTHGGSADPAKPSKKSQDLIDLMHKRGLDAASLKTLLALPRAEFAATVRPIKPSYLRVALVCIYRGEPSKADLRAQFEASLGLNKLSAQSHVSIVVGALTHLGAIRVEANIIKKEQA